jgi:DNA mismatch repair protein MutL
LKIQPLPLDVVHLIAAGEVIDSLGAVVRELGDNAIDAGATRITVSLFPDRWRIQVADNGSGIEIEDLKQAATAHSTSKISDRDDLFHITSLGFRGEALHSLAQLAELEIYSRPESGDYGWHLTYDRLGEVVSCQEVAIAPGTIVNVSNLFANWDARREGLPDLNYQLRHVQMVIYHLALCYPQVNWIVRQDSKPWFQIVAGKTAQQIIPQILPKVRVDDLRYVEMGGDGETEELGGKWRIELTLGLPDRCHRHRADWVKVAVNGRIVKAPELENTVIGGLARTLPRDRYPVCFLHLHLPPQYIDWNRHPAKVEIYLQQVEYWQTQVIETIERALQLSASAIDRDVYTHRVGKLLTAAEQQGGYQSQKRAINPELSESGGLRAIELRAVAQVLNTYIVAEHPDGLWLVEQHIAHERVLYEQINAAWQILPLESPLVVSNLSERQIDQLHAIGVDIDVFGEGLWAVRSAPAPLLMREDLADAIVELSQGGDLQAAQVATACRCAIRNGTSLALPDMQSLLDRWQRTRNPHTCPHGRPIYLSFRENALARSFRRHWVIGKSHGI